MKENLINEMWFLIGYMVGLLLIAFSSKPEIGLGVIMFFGFRYLGMKIKIKE